MALNLRSSTLTFQLITTIFNAKIIQEKYFFLKLKLSVSFTLMRLILNQNGWVKVFVPTHSSKVSTIGILKLIKSHKFARLMEGPSLQQETSWAPYVFSITLIQLERDTTSATVITYLQSLLVCLVTIVSSSSPLVKTIDVSSSGRLYIILTKLRGLYKSIQVFDHFFINI